MSFGMAAYAVAGFLRPESGDLSDELFSGLGVAMAVAVVALLLWGRRNQRHGTT
jgi:hypothetical protein